VHMSFKG